MSKNLCQNCGELICDFDSFCQKCSLSEYSLEDLEREAKDQLWIQMHDHLSLNADLTDWYASDFLMFNERDGISIWQGHWFALHDILDEDAALDTLEDITRNFVRGAESNWYIFLFETRVSKDSRLYPVSEVRYEAISQYLLQMQNHAGRTEDTEAVIVICAGLKDGSHLTSFAYRNDILENFGPSSDEQIVELQKSDYWKPWRSEIDCESWPLLYSW